MGNLAKPIYTVEIRELSDTWICFVDEFNGWFTVAQNLSGAFDIAVDCIHMNAKEGAVPAAPKAVGRNDGKYRYTCYWMIENGKYVGYINEDADFVTPPASIEACSGYIRNRLRELEENRKAAHASARRVGRPPVYNDEHKRRIRELSATGMTHTEIASETGFPRASVAKLLRESPPPNGKASDPTASKHAQRTGQFQHSEEVRERVRTLYEEGNTKREVAELVNLTENQVTVILRPLLARGGFLTATARSIEEARKERDYLAKQLAQSDRKLKALEAALKAYHDALG